MLKCISIHYLALILIFFGFKASIALPKEYNENMYSKHDQIMNVGYYQHKVYLYRYNAESDNFRSICRTSTYTPILIVSKQIIRNKDWDDWSLMFHKMKPARKYADFIQVKALEGECEGRALYMPATWVTKEDSLEIYEKVVYATIAQLARDKNISGLLSLEVLLEDDSFKTKISQNIDNLILDINNEFKSAFNGSSKKRLADFYHKWQENSQYKRVITRKRIHELIEKCFQISIQSDDIDVKFWFVKNFPNTNQSEQAIQNIYSQTKKQNSIAGYGRFVKEYPSASQSKQAVDSIYKLVVQKRNLAGYAWFLNEYSNYPIAKTALQDMHKLAYDITTTEDSLEAYNDFIIAYPYARQIKEALNVSYDIEEKKYSGWFKSNDKLARALLVKSKQLEIAMSDTNKTDRDGYLLVIDRMNKLLQDKFPAEEATLRYLESEEFKTFFKDVKISLEKINNTLDIIADNTSNIDSINTILKDQSRMMNVHFENAAQDRNLATQYAQQHREWEKFMHLRDKGYN